MNIEWRHPPLLLFVFLVETLCYLCKDKTNDLRILDVLQCFFSLTFLLKWSEKYWGRFIENKITKHKSVKDQSVFFIHFLPYFQYRTPARIPISISIITMSITLLEMTLVYIFLKILRLLLNSRSDSTSLALVLSKASLWLPRSWIISFPETFQHEPVNFANICDHEHDTHQLHQSL